jgi:hypothetical protein
MTTRDEAPIGAPCWIELFTSDLDATRSFYSQLFGWTFADPQEELGGYFNVSKDGKKVAGGMTNTPESGAPDGWSIYLAVADAEKAAELADANGGAVLSPAMEVMALGSMVIITDPGGAAIGGWQPGEHQGFEVYGEPDTAAWFELHTRQHPEAVAFYEEVFGSTTVKVSDADELRYTMLVEGDEQLAGIMDAGIFPDDAPLGWSIYFGTADLDASMAKVTELGGRVVIGPDDTPYGRLAGCTDPTGISFKLQQPPPEA